MIIKECYDVALYSKTWDVEEEFRNAIEAKFGELNFLVYADAEQADHVEEIMKTWKYTKSNDPLVWPFLVVKWKDLREQERCSFYEGEEAIQNCLADLNVTGVLKLQQ